MTLPTFGSLSDLAAFCFDVDNTICLTKGLDYRNSKPNKQIIKLINKLYKKGHIVKIFTARFMGRNSDNFTKARKQGYFFTKSQLNKWGLKYTKLFVGKPSADVYFDDKALGFNKKLFLSYLKKLT